MIQKEKPANPWIKQSPRDSARKSETRTQRALPTAPTVFSSRQEPNGYVQVLSVTVNTFFTAHRHLSHSKYWAPDGLMKIYGSY
jgi:SRSO17 transposase